MAPRIPKPGRDLASLRPDLAKQAYGWDPSSVTFCAGKELDWICPLGHVWNARVSSRKNGSGCSVCSGHKVLVGFNDLATLNPELASQAFGWDATTVPQWTKKRFEWQCSLGHVWPAAVRERSNGNGCPYCANKKVLVGFNDLATTHPAIAAQSHGWDPTTVTYGSKKRLNWLCENGHVWPAAVEKRSAGQGCSICSGRQVLLGFNDLATTHPAIAAQAHEWDPTTVSAGSDWNLDWRCSLGHVWPSTVSNRVAGNGCAVCSGRQVLLCFNDLATTHPAIAAQAHGWDSTTVTHGSDKKFDWRCSLGHIWSAAVSSRSLGRGCAVCSGRQVLVGFNDFASRNPEIATQAHGWDPTTVTYGSKKKLDWRCEEGHAWPATVDSRSRGQGCPSCAPLGFDPNKPGWLYLIEHVVEDMLQIGITNHPEQRLTSHARRGWTPIEVMGPFNIGEVAYQWEQSILKYLRAHGALFASDAGIEKFDGYTEAWLRSSFPVTSLKELRALVFDDEEAA